MRTLTEGLSSLDRAPLAVLPLTAQGVFGASPAARRLEARGSLLLLGGVDSTSDTGALSELRPRALEFTPERTTVLSYRGAGKRYRAPDTHRDLDRVARAVSQQVARAPRPRTVLGHSQASAIVDRILARDLPAPERSIVVAPAPPVDIPPPGRRGTGNLGGDIARGLSWAIDPVGLRPLALDSPTSPTNLGRVVVRRAETARLAVWALGDSVWLDGDWRRPGERNVVALSDHVGAVRNGHTHEAALAFLRGRLLEDDEASWRAIPVEVLRHAFEPWRP